MTPDTDGKDPVTISCDTEPSLRDVCRALRRHALPIGAIVVVATVTAAVLAFRKPPQYRAQKALSVASKSLSAARYFQLCQSTSVIDRVRRRAAAAEKPGTTDARRSPIFIKKDRKGNNIAVSSTSPDPEAAAALLDIWADVFRKHASKAAATRLAQAARLQLIDMENRLDTTRASIGYLKSQVASTGRASPPRPLQEELLRRSLIEKQVSETEQAAAVTQQQDLLNALRALAKGEEPASEDQRLSDHIEILLAIEDSYSISDTTIRRERHRPAVTSLAAFVLSLIGACALVLLVSGTGERSVAK